MDRHCGRKRPSTSQEAEDDVGTVKRMRRADEDFTPRTPSPPLSDDFPRESSPLSELPLTPAFPRSASPMPGYPATVDDCAGKVNADDRSRPAASLPPPVEGLFEPNVEFVDVPRPPNPYAWPKDVPIPTAPGEHPAWATKLDYALPAWAFKCPFNFRPGQFPRVYDSKAACITHDGKYVITSVTNSFVPEPVWGRIALARCADGSFGQNDYMHWPQLFVNERGLRYLPAMPKTSDNSLDDGEMFTPMQKADFVVTHSVTEVPLGVVDKYQRAKLREVIHRLQVKVYEVLNGDVNNEHDELSWLWVTLTTSWERLAYPATRRDLVIAYCNVQRMYRTIRGYLTWYTDLCGPVNGRKPSVHDLMGAFTTDMAVATMLKELGVPVWHMRSPCTFTDEHVILGWTNFAKPPKALNEPGVFSGGSLFDGIAGPRHLRFIRTCAFNYQDVEKVPMPAKWGPFTAAPSTSSSRNTLSNRPHLPSLASRPAMNAQDAHEAGLSGSKQADVAPKSLLGTKSPSAMPKGRQPPKKHGQPRERLNKKVDTTLQHKWMPPCIRCWTDAVEFVDEDATSVRCDQLWPYWFPEPTGCIRSTSGRRVATMIRNWLTIRPAWLSIQRDGSTVREERAASAHHWRIFLNAEADRQQRGAELQAKVGQGESLTGVQRAKMRCFEAFENKFKGHGLTKDEQPDWFGKLFPPFDAATCVSQDMHRVDVPMRQVIWELHELSFRAELSELDRHFFPWTEEGEVKRLQRDVNLAKVFRTHHLFAAEYIPSTPVGLAARDPLDRVETLEALRCLLIDWPRAPPSLFARLTKDTARDIIEAAEKTLAVFYCQSFYRESGRLPVLPRSPPMCTVTL